MGFKNAVHVILFLKMLFEKLTVEKKRLNYTESYIISAGCWYIKYIKIRYTTLRNCPQIRIHFRQHGIPNYVLPFKNEYKW